MKETLSVNDFAGQDGVLTNGRIDVLPHGKLPDDGDIVVKVFSSCSGTESFFHAFSSAPDGSNAMHDSNNLENNDVCENEHENTRRLGSSICP
jgi:hypothetical protein